MSDHTPEYLGIPAMAEGLRDGKAGFVPRLALTVTAAVFSLAGVMMVLGMVEASGQRIQDEQVFLGLFLAVAVWCALLIPVWRTYPRWRAALTTILTCVIIIICTIATGGLIGALMRNPEFLIISTSLLGAGAMIAVIASAIHRSSRGKAIVGPRGQVDVRCPACQYSLSGLDSTACPECGHRCTIDELILAQGYEGARQAESPHPALPGAEAVGG